MNSSSKTRLITGIAILIALEVGLCFISNYVTIGTVNLNLALIPIVIGACLYGPVVGLILGLVNGAIVLVAPGTSVFLATSLGATIVLCLLKTGLAGLISGFVYKALRKKNDFVAVLIASIVVPIVNTGLFILGVFAFFMPLYQEWAGEGANAYAFVITTTLTINFLIEFAINVVLATAVHRIIVVVGKNQQKKKLA